MNPSNTALHDAGRAGPARDDWSIELLRGLAALLVVAAHYRGLTGADAGLMRFAFTGVDLFFVISGFVFAPYLLGKPVPLASHALRRFFRIYPLYAVAVLAYAGLHWTQGQGVEHLSEHLLFLHTWQTREQAFFYNPAFWSLPPEVEFYLLLPLLAACSRGIIGLAWLGGLALAVHLAVAFASPVDPAAVNWAWRLSFHLPGLLIEFVLGGLAAWWVRRGMTPAWRCACLVLGLLGWWVLARLFIGLTAHGGEAAVNAIAPLRGNLGLLAACAYSLIVVAWVGWIERPADRWVRLSRGLGHLSYGVYLFHNLMPPLLAPLRAALSGWAFAGLCLLSTVALAALLHVAWERPWRDAGRAWAARFDRTRPA